MDGNMFKKGMGALAQAFPNIKIEYKTFWVFLKDLKEEDYFRAISELITSQTEIYPGTNIIALIRQNALNENRLTGGEAWAKVVKATGSVGSWGYPDFKDDLIQRAVDGVGWQSICLSENISIERAHFLKIYDSLEIRKKKEEVLIKSKDNKVNGLIEDLSNKLDVSHSTLKR